MFEMFMKLMETEEGRKEAKELIAHLRKQVEPYLEFVTEEFGSDLNALFDGAQDFIIAKTKRGYDGYIKAGFEPAEALLLVANQKAELLSSIGKAKINR